MKKWAGLRPVISGMQTAENEYWSDPFLYWFFERLLVPVRRWRDGAAAY